MTKLLHVYRWAIFLNWDISDIWKMFAHIGTSNNVKNACIVIFILKALLSIL
jgi:hypothetical protein